MVESVRNQMAKAFAEGIKKGKTEDEIVAELFGVGSVEELSETQQNYFSQIKKSLAKRAAELQKEESERPGSAEFQAAQSCYGTGRYREAEELLLKALDLSGPYSKLGGEIQLWLALAYQANRKEELCIETYKFLESYHPMPAIQKQAAELRFIMEAPRLPLSEEDRVKVPVIDSGYTPRNGRSYQPPPGQPRKKVAKSLEDRFMDEYEPPRWVRNRYVWVAAAAICAGLAWYSTTVR